jgi:pimeloyl-ACP methyl ester carboxylesterase
MVGRFGMAGIVAELPGVGENTLVYGLQGARMLSGILDAVADRADVDQTYVVGHSFSGHLALRCATRDTRIRGVVTTGSPVRSFFADREWQARIPRITADTLLHLTGGVREDLGTLADRLCPLGLTGAELESVRVPVAYLRSTRDEIIPQGEVDVLRRHVRDVRVVDIDDVHASPHHVAESRLWTVVSVLRMREVHNAQSFVVTSVWNLLRANRRLRGMLK